jgi:spermidine synthase
VFVADQVYPVMPEAALTPVKFTAAALLVVPPAIALGWSFPLMSSALLRRRPEDAGRHLATLYFVNSAGGVAGVLVSGFVLLDRIGLPATLAVAGVLNLAIARVAWTSSDPVRSPQAPESIPSSSGQATALLLLAVAALTGLASFGYEIAWIRMLSLVLGSSTHSFELMLAAFIAGLALGGAWVRRRIDAWTDPARALGVVQVVMGVAALATLPAYRYSFDAVSWLVTTLPQTSDGYLGYFAGSSGIALAVMLPATFCAGMTLPLISAVLYRSSVGERAMGRVYAANAAGGIAGVFLAAHFGLPYLGVHGTLVAAAGVDLVAGLALLAAAGANSRRALVGAVVVGTAALVGFGSYRTDELLSASGVYRVGALPDASSAEVIYPTMSRRSWRRGASMPVRRIPEIARSVSSSPPPIRMERCRRCAFPSRRPAPRGFRSLARPPEESARRTS